MAGPVGGQVGESHIDGRIGLLHVEGKAGRPLPLQVIAREPRLHQGRKIVGAGATGREDPLLERDPHLLGGLESFVDIASDGAADDGVERWIDLREFAGAGDGLVDHGAQGGQLVFAQEQPAASDAFPQHHAEGKDVRPRIDRLAACLLGSHVAKLALERARIGVAQAAEGACDAEIDDLHRAFEGHHDVLGRDVAMDEAEQVARGVGQLVGVVQTRCRVGHDERAQVVGNRGLGLFRLLEDRCKRLALHQFHREEIFILRAANLGDAHDIGVVQHGGDAGLVEEHGDEVGFTARWGRTFFTTTRVLKPDSSPCRAR
jgi:hypothetical protein